METQERSMDKYARERAEQVAAVTRPRLEACVAAKWWREAIQKPSRPDIGDAKLDGVMDGFRAVAGDRLCWPEKQLDTFEAELAAGIEADIAGRLARRGGHGEPEQWELWSWFVHLSVDYHPDWTLSDATKRAEMDGCDMLVFPPKTDMTVDRGKITLSGGYGAAPEVLWSSEEGAKYWSGKAMSDCAETLAGLADGCVSEPLGRVLGDEVGLLEAHRFTEYVPERPVRQTRDSGTYGDGLMMALSLARAISGAR